jgi:hypothetical protein
LKDEFSNLPPEEQEAVLTVAREIARNPLIRRPSLKTVSMADLYDMTFAPRTPVIEGLLLCGTYIFAGSPKIGKSFFMAQLGYHVAMGLPLWEYPVRKGTVLYLALEDDYSRLQSRLSQMFGVDAVEGLHFATQSKTLAEGLNDQLEEFVALHPDTRLIIVDTLQKVREIGNDSYSYAVDYQNITALKRFSDSHNVAILVVHHTRKMEASDSFDMISGTNGLLGAADGAFILQKKKRTDNEAKMQVVGRDQEDQELTLEFDRDRCVWELTKAEKELHKKKVDPVTLKIVGYIREQGCWTGTATELLACLPDLDLKPNVLTRRLNVDTSVLYNEFNIEYTNKRSGDKRTITLVDLTGLDDDNDDGMTVNDDISKTGAGV